jgi:hypothetical protein
LVKFRSKALVAARSPQLGAASVVQRHPPQRRPLQNIDFSAVFMGNRQEGFGQSQPRLLNVNGVVSEIIGDLRPSQIKAWPIAFKASGPKEAPSISSRAVGASLPAVTMVLHLTSSRCSNCGLCYDAFNGAGRTHQLSLRLLGSASARRSTYTWRYVTR